MRIDLLNELPSWMVTLRSQRKSRSTMRVYRTGVESFLAKHTELTKVNVIDWLATMMDTGAATATIQVWLAGLKQFAKWLAEEYAFDADPILAVKAPKLNQKPVPAMREGEIRAMLTQCGGTKFQDRRDKALLILFTETGVRAAEMLSMKAEDVRLDECTALVLGKGDRYRRVKFSPSAAADLDRYMRARRVAGFSDGPLWIGKTAPLDYGAMVASLKKRAEKAGVVGFHVHRLRHTMAVRWLRGGGSEGGLMAQAGWKTREMVDRYVNDAASDLSHQEFDRLNLGLS